MSEGIIQNFWRSRAVLMSAFGLVGVGAVVGAGSVYLFYFKKKFEDLFQLQSVLRMEVQNLRKDVDKFSQNGGPGTSAGEVAAGERRSAGGLRRSSIKRTVRFRDGYETADDDEYVTASSDSDAEELMRLHGDRYVMLLERI